MTTALSLYALQMASATLPTAEEFSQTGGATSTTKSSVLVGTSTGWGEFASQGNAATWPALASPGAPSGHGLIWDVTTLEGQQFVAGNWQQLVRLHNGVGSGIVADILTRWYIRHADGTYTAIGSSTLAGQTINSTWTTFVTPNASLAATVVFAVGDKLYADVWLNITSNLTGNTTAQTDWGDFGYQSTSGGYGNVLVTPGYVTVLYASGATSAGIGSGVGLASVWAMGASLGHGSDMALRSGQHGPAIGTTTRDQAGIMAAVLGAASIRGTQFG